MRGSEGWWENTVKGLGAKKTKTKTDERVGGGLQKKNNNLHVTKQY